MRKAVILRVWDKNTKVNVPYFTPYFIKEPEPWGGEVALWVRVLACNRRDLSPNPSTCVRSAV